MGRRSIAHARCSLALQSTLWSVAQWLASSPDNVLEPQAVGLGRTFTFRPRKCAASELLTVYYRVTKEVKELSALMWRYSTLDVRSQYVGFFHILYAVRAVLLGVPMASSLWLGFTGALGYDQAAKDGGAG